MILASKVGDRLSQNDRSSYPFPSRNISSFKDLTEVLVAQLQYLLEKSYIGSERISHYPDASDETHLKLQNAEQTIEDL